MFFARFLSTGLRPWLPSNVPSALHRKTSHRLRLPSLQTPDNPALAPKSVARDLAPQQSPKSISLDHYKRF